MTKFGLICLSFALCAGCITKHSGVGKRDIHLSVGETTREEVVRRWGNPDKSLGNVWIWRDWNSIGSKLKCSYYHVGFTLASSRISSCEYRLTFDNNGVLVSVSTSESVPGGAKWTWNPFL